MKTLNDHVRYRYRNHESDRFHDRKCNEILMVMVTLTGIVMVMVMIKSLSC
jgi:hypothetical protein